MRERVLVKDRHYTIRKTGVRIDYWARVEGTVVDGPLSTSRAYRPTVQKQTTTFGIDRLDLKLSVNFLNEERQARLCSKLLGINSGSTWLRISINRELLDHTQPYRFQVVRILWDLFQRGLFIIPTVYLKEGKKAKKLGPQCFDEREAFHRVIDAISFDSVELFFDHSTDIRQYLAEKYCLRHVKTTLYSKDNKKTALRFFRKKSFLKAYDKAECKRAFGEVLFEYEAEVPYRLELTFYKPDRPNFTWKGFDCDNRGLLNLLGEDLTRRIEQVCPEVRTLAGEDGVHDELKTILMKIPMEKLRFPADFRMNRMEGKTNLTEDLKMLRLSSGEVNEKIVSVTELVEPGVFEGAGCVLKKEGFIDPLYIKDGMPGPQ